MCTHIFDSSKWRGSRPAGRFVLPLILIGAASASAWGCAHRKHGGPTGRDDVKIVITPAGIVPPVAGAGPGARITFDSTRGDEVKVQFMDGQCPLVEGCTFKVPAKGSVSRDVGLAGQSGPYHYEVTPEPSAMEVGDPINGTLEITPRDG